MSAFRQTAFPAGVLETCYGPVNRPIGAYYHRRRRSPCLLKKIQRNEDIALSNPTKARFNLLAGYLPVSTVEAPGNDRSVRSRKKREHQAAMGLCIS